MIAFASLILGLVTGVMPVTVLVSHVAAVEFVLDGSVVGRRTSLPWTVPVDFGAEFVPHELVARAFDGKGKEIASVRQWVNLPRPPAEVVLLPERDVRGRIVAVRVSWQSIVGAKPVATRVTFDRRPIALEAGRVAIPEFDASSTHVLSAELEFPMNVRSRQDLVFGGGSAGDATSELTAVPVRVREGRLPPLPELAGWLMKKGEPLEVTAVEHEPANVLFVRDITTAEPARLLAPPAGQTSVKDESRSAIALGRDDRVEVFWPVARWYGTSTLSELFEHSRQYRASEMGIYWLLTKLYNVAPDDPPRRFADAVAVAGLKAFGGYSRRAVVLVLEGAGARRDASEHSSATVRRYLSRIRVPLRVWTLGEPAGPSWGVEEDISSYSKLQAAVGRLKEDLESQWILWVAGRHLPQQIELSEKARGIELVM